MDCKWCRGDHPDNKCRIRAKLQMMEEGATAEEVGFLVLEYDELVRLLELKGKIVIRGI